MIVSIHAPLARCDVDRFFQIHTVVLFQSTHLLRGATRMPDTISREVEFQSTHLLRGATRFAVAAESPNVVSIHAPLARCDAHLIFIAIKPNVSIHAPLARCDSFWTRLSNKSSGFNPRTSCEVRRRNDSAKRLSATFQSTHLLRGATAKGRFYSLFCAYRWGYFPTDTVCSY